MVTQVEQGTKMNLSDPVVLLWKRPRSTDKGLGTADTAQEFGPHLPGVAGKGFARLGLGRETVRSLSWALEIWEDQSGRTSGLPVVTPVASPGRYVRGRITAESI